MDKIKAGERRARFLKIEELYRSGLTMREIGLLIEPPITAQRVGSLLRQGARLGLYVMPPLHRESRAQKLMTSEDAAVLEVLCAAGNPRAAAKQRGFSEPALRLRYGHLIKAMRAQRVRQRIIDDYRALAARLGRNPVASENVNLARRITRRFGSFRAFYEAVGVTPDYARPPRKTRRPRRPQ